MHIYEVRARNDHRGIGLISDALPFGRLWYDGPQAAANAIGYAKFYSRFARCCDSPLRRGWQRGRRTSTRTSPQRTQHSVQL
jgi:hypothetical protein